MSWKSVGGVDATAALKTRGSGSVLREGHVLARLLILFFFSFFSPPFSPPFLHLFRAPVLGLMPHSCPMHTLVVEDVPINIPTAALSSATTPTSPLESLSPMCRPDWSWDEERFPGTSGAGKSPKESSGQVSHELKHS